MLITEIHHILDDILHIYGDMEVVMENSKGILTDEISISIRNLGSTKLDKFVKILATGEE